MQVQDINRLFNQFTFEKTVDEVISAAKSRATAIRTKIEERIGRVRSLKASHGVTDAAWADILTQLRESERRGAAQLVYNTKSVGASNNGLEETVTIGVGTINDILTESSFIEGEKLQAERLDQIERNLRPTTVISYAGTIVTKSTVTLNFEELRFLGF